MKILQVINFFSPVHGGSAEVPYKLSKELAKRGHEVTIYTSDYKLSKEWGKSAQELQINVSPFRTWLDCASLLVTPGIFERARKEVEHFDVVHMHNYRTFQNIVIHNYAKRYGIPYVIQAHGSLTTYFHRGTLKRIFDKLWGYKILQGVANVIAITETEAGQYQSMGVSEDKIEIVPNGIDLSEFENLPQRGEFRRKYGLGNSEKIILYLGRIHKTKGLNMLLKAFHKLCEELENIKLVIAGPDDGYLPALKRVVKELSVEEKVLFTGSLYNEDKLEAYVDADVYVLPSVYEIFGITVLEACACGTPVIVTDRCGIADVIDAQAGLVVSYDKEELSNAILCMLGDDKMRLQFGEKGKLLVCDNFSWGGIAEQIENMYLSVIQS